MCTYPPKSVLARTRPPLGQTIHRTAINRPGQGSGQRRGRLSAAVTYDAILSGEGGARCGWLDEQPVDPSGPSTEDGSGVDFQHVRQHRGVNIAEVPVELQI